MSVAFSVKYFDVFSLRCALGLHTFLAMTGLRLEHNLSFVSIWKQNIMLQAQLVYLGSKAVIHYW